METNLQGKYKMPKKKFLSLATKRRIKIGIYAISIISAVLSGAYAMDATARWGATHEVVYQTPVEVKIQSPIVIKDRPQVIQLDAVIYEVKPEFYKGLNDTEKKICDTFGLHCREAIAVAKAESGMRESAFNINTNNTIDVGLFQINSIHFSKTGCSLKEVSTTEGNIKCAKQIYDASGWNPWVAYNTGAYLKFLK
jgi:hypothetical protein